MQARRADEAWRAFFLWPLVSHALKHDDGRLAWKGARRDGEARAVAALDGEARMYGIALDYIGHANVLLVQNAGEWDVEAYVDWNETAGTVNYEWDQGYHTY